MFTFVAAHATKSPVSIFHRAINTARQLARRRHTPDSTTPLNVVTGGSILDFNRIVTTKLDKTDTFIPCVYPEDTIFDLKRKIAIISKIAVYRQHLYIDPKTPMSYNILINDRPRVFDIHDTANWSKLENMPINSEIYGNRDTIMIDANDEFDICANMVQHMVKNTLDLYLVDLQDYITPQDNKAQRLIAREQFIKIVAGNTYYMDLIYTSFVQIFFPCITRSTFAEFISSGLVDIIPKYVLPQAESSVLHLYHGRTIKYPDISAAITRCRFTVIHNMQFVPAILFDVIRLINNITQVAMCGKQYIVKYRADTRVVTAHPKPSQVIVDIMTKRKSHISVRLVIDKLTYSVITTWPDHKMLLFSDIIKLTAEILNPVIGMINKHGNEIFSNMPMQLPLLSEHNAIQAHTSVSITWNAIVAGSDVGRFEQLISNWKYAGLIREHQSTAYVSEFFINKGMFVSDIRKLYNHVNIANTYAYMTVPTIYNRWQMIFKRGKLLRIHYQQNSVKFELTNIRDAEYKIMEYYICNLIHDATETLKWNIAPTNVKKIRRLKENDPIAFGERGYSEACQQTKQPIGYNIAEYNALSESAKATKVKYTNFTTNENYYYGCPSRENPYLYFITGVHPDNICLPCCKSTKIQNPDKLKLYNICLRQHKYTDTGASNMSKYVINFRDDIPIGRLAYLPTDTVDLIMHGEAGIIPTRQDAITHHSYFAIGVPQNTSSVARCGLLFCILQLFSLSLPDFINAIKTYLIKNPMVFHSVLESRLHEYFTDIDDFVTNMHAVFIVGGISKIQQTVKPSKWNYIFRDFAKFIFNINLIMFVKGTEVQLIIPENVGPHYFNRVVIIIQTDQNFYPIVGVRLQDFVATSEIRTRLFTDADEPIKCIKLLVPGQVVARLLPLQFIMNNFKVQTTHVNAISVVYGVVIDGVFVSVHDTLYDDSYPNRSVSMPVYPAYAALMAIIGRINTCIAEYSAADGMFKQDYNKADNIIDQVVPLYTYITPTQFYVFNNMQVGFLANNTPFFHLPTAKTATSNIITLSFDPIEFNTVLYNRVPPTDIGIARAIHDKFEYNLVLLQYTHYFNSERNETLRASYAKGARKQFTEFELSVLKSGIDYGLPFDRVTYNTLCRLIKTGDLEVVRGLLTTVGQNIFTAYIEPTSYSNILSATNYCVSGKLSIHMDRLPVYIDILAHDLMNPLIGVSLFMVIDRVIDKRKFEQPVGEKIKFINIPSNKFSRAVLTE